MAQCLGITRAGTRCKAQAIASSDHCYYHAPELEGRRKANNSRGGKRGGRGRPVADVARIQTRLEELAQEVLDGAVEPYRGAVAGQLFGGALKAISTSLKAREQEKLLARLEEVEERLERQAQEEGRRWG